MSISNIKNSTQQRWGYFEIGIPVTKKLLNAQTSDRFLIKAAQKVTLVAAAAIAFIPETIRNVLCVPTNGIIWAANKTYNYFKPIKQAPKVEEKAAVKTAEKAAEKIEEKGAERTAEKAAERTAEKAEQTDDNCVLGKEIVPYSSDEAKKWAPFNFGKSTFDGVAFIDGKYQNVKLYGMYDKTWDNSLNALRTAGHAAYSTFLSCMGFLGKKGTNIVLNVIEKPTSITAIITGYIAKTTNSYKYN